MDRKLILSCEHAGNKVPEEYHHLFEGNREVLRTHRGVDIGAGELTRLMGSVLNTDAYLHEVTRLLVDLNRSLHNPSAFSEFIPQGNGVDREEIIRKYYQPHREKVREEVRKSIATGRRVLHVSVHSFTPRMDGVERNADIGFLYDPQRVAEKELSWTWRRQLQKMLPHFKCRMNYPYRGTLDGFSTSLKKDFTEDSYWGIELEVNQKFPQEAGADDWKHIQKQIAYSLKYVLESMSIAG